MGINAFEWALRVNHFGMGRCETARVLLSWLDNRSAAAQAAQTKVGDEFGYNVRRRSVDPCAGANCGLR